MEKRYKLSEVQFEAIKDAEARVVAAKAAYQDALWHANVVGNLVSDAAGVDSKHPSTVDPPKRERVVETPETPPSA